MMSKALRMEEAAAGWLARFDKTASVPEPKDVVAAYSSIDTGFADWVGASLEHRVTFLRLYATWWRANRLRVLAPSRAASLPGKRRWAKVSLATAACLLIGLCVVVARYGLLQGWQVYETAVGRQQTVRLPDGSRVELNTNSRIASRVTGGRRAVVIEKGEAYFDVVRDVSRPFVVEAGDSRLVVLGTQFNVRRREDDIKVLVASGQVRIESRSEGSDVHPIVASKGFVAVARADGIVIEHRSERELAAELGWLRGMLIFEQRELASIAAEFNRYNRIKLVPADSDSAATLIGGSFKVDNVEHFVRLLESDFGFRAERHGDTVLIKKSANE